LNESSQNNLARIIVTVTNVFRPKVKKLKIEEKNEIRFIPFSVGREEVGSDLGRIPEGHHGHVGKLGGLVGASGLLGRGRGRGNGLTVEIQLEAAVVTGVVAIDVVVVVIVIVVVTNLGAVVATALLSYGLHYHPREATFIISFSLVISLYIQRLSFF